MTPYALKRKSCFRYEYILEGSLCKFKAVAKPSSLNSTSTAKAWTASMMLYVSNVKKNTIYRFDRHNVKGNYFCLQTINTSSAVSNT